MKNLIKSLSFLSILLLLNGCFSLSNLNPFSYDFFNSSSDSLEIVAPENSPKWLKDRYIKDYISAIGLSQNIDEKKEEFYKKEVYLSASNNLLNKIYLKTGKRFKEYSDEFKNKNLFEKDIKNFAKKVSLKALTYAKVDNSWIDENTKNYYIQISVNSKIIAEIIQENSKQIFDENETLQKEFLSNEAKENIIEYLNN